MAKTITIREDVYKAFARFKGKKSFSQAIDELLRMVASKDKELLLAYYGICNDFPEVKRNKEVREVEALR